LKKEKTMKYLTLLIAAIILTTAAPTYAQDATPVGDVRVSVNGLVCDFCARALEKVFSKEKAVQGIDVNLDTKIITINFNDGQSIDDERITQLITNAGYNVEGFHHDE
jgi:copper chaperone CopZ